MKKALILTDGKAGHENQSKAFARAIKCDFDIIAVRFRSRAAKALSYLFDNLRIASTRLFEIAGDGRFDPAAGGYDVVIGTGSGTFYAAKTIARRIGKPCAVVLYPRGYRIRSFDCILAPEFDDPPPAGNVVRLPVNLVAADEAFYAEAVKAFRERHAPSGRPAVAVIIGGPNKCSTLEPEWMRERLEEIFGRHRGRSRPGDGAAGEDPEIWVTTSRRTPPGVESVVDSFPFDYKLIYSRDRFNPVPAFVSLASHLYVTAESTGMLSEACSFGKAEVHVLDNLKPGPHKFRRFAEACSARGSEKADLAPLFESARRLLERSSAG